MINQDCKSVLRVVGGTFVLFLGLQQGFGQSLNGISLPQGGDGSSTDAATVQTPNRTLSGMRRMTQAERKAAAQRLKVARANAAASGFSTASAFATNAAVIASPSTMPMPNYFGGIPNWANSPVPTIDSITHLPVAGTGIKKFVDTLPGLGAANKNTAGQYIPIATPMLVNGLPKYAGSDYYEIGLVDSNTQRFHPDLPVTRLRGYVDLNPAGDTSKHYLGPFIIARKGTPVRILFKNQLPTGNAGKLFLPVDTTIMGAGLGPDGTHSYTQNRANIHLHGGNTPWISDGTPHQWTVPAGETSTIYLKGVSTKDVPDMPASGAGIYIQPRDSPRVIVIPEHP